jgi:glucan phosphoethanolaminetransferase (alkaline phosphatase superfamily)
MELGNTFFIMAILIIAIWVIVEVKRLKHKIFAIFLIILILFMYFSFNIAIKDNEINLKETSGIIKASNLYLDWIVYTFNNLKSISAYAFKKDWRLENNTLEEK